MSRYKISAELDITYDLVLNPMMSNIESVHCVGTFNSREEAKAFYNSHLASEPYKELGPNMFGPEEKMYHKVFKKDSPLEWLNPIMENEWVTPSCHNHGLHDMYSNISNVVILNKV